MRSASIVHPTLCATHSICPLAAGARAPASGSKNTTRLQSQSLRAIRLTCHRCVATHRFRIEASSTRVSRHSHQSHRRHPYPAPSLALPPPHLSQIGTQTEVGADELAAALRWEGRFKAASEELKALRKELEKATSPLAQRTSSLCLAQLTIPHTALPLAHHASHSALAHHTSRRALAHHASHSALPPVCILSIPCTASAHSPPRALP